MKIILALMFFINTIIAFTISLPSNVNAPTYKMLLDELKKRNIDFKIKKIDFSNYKTNYSKIKIEIEKTDLLFVTGAYLDITNKFIKPSIPFVFLGVQNAQNINAQNSIGVFRTTNISKILEKSTEIVPTTYKPMAILYKKHSPLCSLISNFLQASKKSGLNIIAVEYENIKDIEKIFIDNKISSLLLFPPSINQNLIPKLVEFQNRYKIPVITQLKRDIQLGVLGGVVIDYEKIVPTLVDLIINIKNGISIKELHNYYFSNKYILNLYAINNLKINLDKDIIKKSEILNIAPVKDNKTPNIKPGHYKIAIAKDTIKKIEKCCLKKLANVGYVSGINLTVVHFDKKAPKDTDCLFTSGGRVKRVIENNPDQKVLFIGTKDVLNKLHLNPKNHFGVFRSSTPKILEMVENFNEDFKKIAIIIQKDEKQILKQLDVINVNNLKFKVKLYENQNDLENIFKELKKDKIDAIFTFPLSIKDQDKNKIISLQYEYNIPLIASLKSDVEKGFAIGVVIDFDKYQEKLAEIADNIFQKRVIPLPFYYASSFYYINFNTINKMHLKIDKNHINNIKIYMGE